MTWIHHHSPFTSLYSCVPVSSLQKTTPKTRRLFVLILGSPRPIARSTMASFFNRLKRLKITERVKHLQFQIKQAFDLIQYGVPGTNITDDPQPPSTYLILDQQANQYLPNHVVFVSWITSLPPAKPNVSTMATEHICDYHRDYWESYRASIRTVRKAMDIWCLYWKRHVLFLLRASLRDHDSTFPELTKSGLSLHLLPHLGSFLSIQRNIHSLFHFGAGQSS